MVHDARLPRTSPTDVRLHPPSRTALASMNIPALGDQSLRAPKRRRDAVDAEQSKSSSTQPPCKKTRRYNVSQETDERYWDSLSKLWLTRRALSELNRRNGQVAFPVESVARSHQSRNATGQFNPVSTLLKRFARRGGPDNSDLVGYPNPSASTSTANLMASSQSSSKARSKSGHALNESNASTSKTKKTSPYDPNLEQNLIDNDIYPSHCDLPDDRLPSKSDNYNEIRRDWENRGRPLSPSRFCEETFDRFVRTNSRALNEDAVMSDVFPSMRGLEALRNLSSVSYRILRTILFVSFSNLSPTTYLPAECYRIFVEALGVYSRRGQCSFVSHDDLERRSYRLPSKVNGGVWYFGSFRSEQESYTLV